MSRSSRSVALSTVVAACLAVATGLSLPPLAAGASTYGPPRLIDTDLVVGAPQNLVTGATTGVAWSQAHPATTNAPHAFGFSAPKITEQPANASVPAGTTASFTAAATGSPTPTVQWYVSSGGSAFTSISGARSTTYSFTASSSQNGNEYEAVFSNFFGRATTSSATLSVGSAALSPPVVTENPTSQTVASGTTVSFTAAATGSPTPTVQWYVSSGGSAFTSIGGATSTTYSFSASTSESGNEYEAVFTNTTTAVNTATTTAATLTVTPAPVTPEESSNWSGYADTGATFTSVSGTWTVPSVNCSGGATTYSAQWVGIDGDTSSTVEQDGTSADCSGATASYNAWYEMYGDNSVNSGDEVELSYPVSAGDVITASVSESANVWTLTLQDGPNGSKWNFSTSIDFAGAAQSSAEWIVERPEICGRTCSLTTLADFGTVTFSGAAATSTTNASGTISSYADSPIEMVNGSTVIAEPSGLASDGTGFTDT